jgi:hypothetical protein
MAEAARLERAKSLWERQPADEMDRPPGAFCAGADRESSHAGLHWC